MQIETYGALSSKTSIFVFAGDQSGDEHAAPIIQALKKMNRELEIWGVGGGELQKAGMELLYDCRDFGTVGLHSLVGNIAFLRKLIAEMVFLIKCRKPALLFLVDCGGINLRIAKSVKKSLPGMQIFQFISPQVWASRPWRITTIKNNVSSLLVIFPFEQQLFLERGIKSKFVGHPLVNRLSSAAGIDTKYSFCNLIGLDPQKPIVGLFPGSRKQEIAHILPVFLKAASALSNKENNMQFVISIANPLLGRAIESCMSKADAGLIRGRNVFFVPTSKNHELMSHCDIAWAKCGTITLEVGLFGKPMLICYRGSRLDHLLVCLLKTTRFVGLPNILAGQEIVPELLQNDCNPGLIARLTLHISNNPCVYDEMSKKLMELAGKLGSRDYVFECVKEIQESLIRCREQDVNRDHVAH